MQAPAEQIQVAELVVNQKTGEIRQAGADGSGAFITEFRRRCESSLYLFSKGVLGLDRMTKSLHAPACKFLSEFPPYRKLLLMPRDHLKTSICRALAIHMLLQPPESNMYIPNKEGASTRVLLANETATNAEHQLRWIALQFEGNQLLRALWPHRVWRNPRAEAKKWNEKEIVLPRSQDYPEASIETIGVGGAVTGRHYDVMIKDDLVTLEAANSVQQMLTAIEWHIASRALMDDPDKSLEVIIGTRWAVHDLYEQIETSDPSVECLTRRVIEDGDPIFPEMFKHETIARLKSELGPLFPLLYMNSAADPELVDFDMTRVRKFSIKDDLIHFSGTEDDLVIRDRLEEYGNRRKEQLNLTPQHVGKRLTPENFGLVMGLREDHLKVRRVRSV